MRQRFRFGAFGIAYAVLDEVEDIGSEAQDGRLWVLSVLYYDPRSAQYPRPGAWR